MGFIRLAQPRRSAGEDHPVDEGEGSPPDVSRRYLHGVTAVIAVGTATLLCLDYLFKATSARQLEADELGAFFAGYYALLNLSALLFQLLLATWVLRRVGVLASAAPLPALLLCGGIFVLIVGPALIVILLLKGADGSLRHSRGVDGPLRINVRSMFGLEREVLVPHLVRELVEKLRMSVLIATLASRSPESSRRSKSLRQLLLDLLSDKADQALERAFRILQLLHAEEDLRSAMVAVVSGEKAQHAQAVEYLDNLAFDLDPKVRDMLHVAIDRMEEEEHVRRARTYIEAAPASAAEALSELVDDGDEAIRSVSRYYAEHDAAWASTPKSAGSV